MNDVASKLTRLLRRLRLPERIENVGPQLPTKWEAPFQLPPASNDSNRPAQRTSKCPLIDQFCFAFK